MVSPEFALPADQSENDPHPVSRGSKIQLGFLGIDSLYLVLEYPYLDVFNRWSVLVPDTTDPRLHDGIPFDDFLVRRGGLGYRLSIWEGDARLFITNRVTEQLKATSSTKQGMGVMLQLGPKWLLQYGDFLSPETLSRNIHAQFAVFGVQSPEQFPCRLNRMDITADVLGLNVADLSMDEWRDNWVGFASPRDFHIAHETRRLEGLSVGSSEGVVRFKIYDKVAESKKRKTSGFWRSVWGEDETEDISVARFEWSIKCYAGRFGNIRYLSDFTFDGFLKLLNYVSLT
jgi:hypothetical protein